MMNVTMKSNFSDRHDHPQKGDVLKVIDTIRDHCGDIECFDVEWKGNVLTVYPYELESDNETSSSEME